MGCYLLEEERITELDGKPDNEILTFFNGFNCENSKKIDFKDIEINGKIKFFKFLVKHKKNQKLIASLLQTSRILAREKEGIDTLLTPDVCDVFLHYAGLPEKDEYDLTPQNSSEALKCLVNMILNSEAMRLNLIKYPGNVKELLVLIREFNPDISHKSNREWIRKMPKEYVEEIWYFYHRIAFIVTALLQKTRSEWGNQEEFFAILSAPIRRIIASGEKLEKIDADCADEGFKLIFNVFNRPDKSDIIKVHGKEMNELLYGIIMSDNKVVHEDLRQSAVNCFAIPEIDLMPEVLCPYLQKNDPKVELNMDMRFVQRLLDMLEEKLEKVPSSDTSLANTPSDLMAPLFSVLTRLSQENKHIRRYCRQKVLPPLSAEAVKRRPEEEDSFRGKIVRFSMVPTRTKDTATAFLFVLCKNSVQRMIKYTGFGHSAGLLTNFGLLGQINEPRRESDSEDSETEEYCSIRDRVNPVTGSIFQENAQRIIDEMSDEQKEYEAMKLVEAMNKMMEQGIVKPATIGDDGHVKEVKHVLELAKNIPDEEIHSDSD